MAFDYSTKYVYDISSGTAKIYDFQGFLGEQYIYIPSGLGGYPVSYVSGNSNARISAQEVIIQNGFSGNFQSNYFTSNIKRIYFPASINAVNSGFEQCKNLDHVFFNGSKPSFLLNSLPIPNDTAKEIPVYFKVIDYYKTSGAGWINDQSITNLSSNYKSKEHRVYPPYFDFTNNKFAHIPYINRDSVSNSVTFYDFAQDQDYRNPLAAKSLFTNIAGTAYMEGSMGYGWQIYKSGNILIDSGSSTFPYPSATRYDRNGAVIPEGFDVDYIISLYRHYISNVGSNPFYNFKIKNGHGEYSGILNVKNLIPQTEYSNNEYHTYYFPNPEKVKSNKIEFNTRMGAGEKKLYCHPHNDENANYSTIAFLLNSGFSNIALNNNQYSNSPFPSNILNCTEPLSKNGWDNTDTLIQNIGYTLLSNTGISASGDFTAISEIFGINGFDSYGVFRLNTLSDSTTTAHVGTHKYKEFPDMYPQIMFFVAENTEYLKVKVSIKNKFRQLQMFSSLRFRVNEKIVNNATIYSMPSKKNQTDGTCTQSENGDYSYWDIKIPIGDQNIKGGSLVRIEINGVSFFDIEQDICPYPNDPKGYSDSEWPYWGNLYDGRGTAGGPYSCIKYNFNRIVNYPWIKKLLNSNNNDPNYWIDNIDYNYDYLTASETERCNDPTYFFGTNPCGEVFSLPFPASGIYASIVQSDNNGTSSIAISNWEIDNNNLPTSIRLSYKCRDYRDIYGTFYCNQIKEDPNDEYYQDDCSPIGDFRIEFHDIQGIKYKKKIYGYYPATITGGGASQSMCKLITGNHNFTGIQKVFMSKRTGEYFYDNYGPYWVDGYSNYSTSGFGLRATPQTGSIYDSSDYQTQIFDINNTLGVNGVLFEVTGYKYNNVSYNTGTKLFTLQTSDFIGTGFKIEFLNTGSICPEVFNYIEYYPYEINANQFKLEERVVYDAINVKSVPLNPSINLTLEQIRYPDNSTKKLTDQKTDSEKFSEDRCIFGGFILDNPNYIPHGFQLGDYL
jgi:hypothetical protein